MIVGYARTSTVDQKAGLEAQIRDLEAAGCERVWSEHVSSVATRERLEDVLRFVRDGDVLMVCKPDRLARSTSDLLRIVSDLEKRRVGLIVLSMGGSQVDTRTATGKLTVTILGAFAEFERNLMLERQREGIAKAKGEGKYKGRKPTVRNQLDTITRRLAEGAGKAEIARELGVAESSIYRMIALAAQKAA